MLLDLAPYAYTRVPWQVDIHRYLTVHSIPRHQQISGLQGGFLDSTQLVQGKGFLKIHTWLQSGAMLDDLY